MLTLETYPETTHGSCYMPPDIIKRRVYAQCDAAFNLYAAHQRVYEGLAAHGPVLRIRQQGRKYGSAWMHEGRQMRVVKIQNMRTNTIQQRSMQSVDAFAAAK